jgi:hypothetical protein
MNAPEAQEVDWDDPCARAKALKAAYFERLAGGSSMRVRFRAGDNEQEFQSAHAGASLAELKRAWWDAEDECRASQGLSPRPRRFAIRAGSRRF